MSMSLQLKIRRLHRIIEELLEGMKKTLLNRHRFYTRLRPMTIHEDYREAAAAGHSARKEADAMIPDCCKSGGNFLLERVYTSKTVWGM